MEKLCFDSGIQELDCGFGVPLRVNFGDPNFYQRFLTMTEKIQAIGLRLENSGKDGEALLNAMREKDLEIKACLNDGFGLGNDFDKIFGGMNCMAPCGNGNLFIVNFVEALQPLVEEGVRQAVHTAVAAAKAAK